MAKCVQVQLSETTMQYVAALLYVWPEIKLKPLLKALLQHVSRFLCEMIHCNKMCCAKCWRRKKKQSYKILIKESTTLSLSLKIINRVLIFQVNELYLFPPAPPRRLKQQQPEWRFHTNTCTSEILDL